MNQTLTPVNPVLPGGRVVDAPDSRRGASVD